jgi:hypothetical protein
MRPATPREELLSALLYCDTAAHEFQDAVDRELAVRTHLAEIAAALRALTQAAEMLVRSAPEHWRATAYGLPPWLCIDSRHGVRLIFELLLREDWLVQVTSCLDNAGRPIFDQDDVDLFFEVLAKLEETQTSAPPPRLLPGRIGDPILGYRDLVCALLGETGTALAAASTLAPAARPSADSLAAKFAASRSARPVERELMARLLRVDVPVIHGQDVGMVLGLHVELTAPDDPRSGRSTHPTGDTKVSRVFRDGVVSGHIAALKLLESIGTPQSALAQVLNLRYSLIETGAGTPGVDGDSVGLPIALHVVARALDLEPPPWIATGSFEKDGTLKPIDDRAAAIKATAVAVDGLWQGLTGRFTVMGTTLPLTGSTLGDACAQIWPEEWPRARAQAATQYLASSGCTVQIGVPPDPHALTDEHGRPVGVRAAPHDEMLRYLRDYPGVPVILAGPPSVGKSWTVRSITGELEREGWCVLVLRFRDNHLPSAAEAARCAEFAIKLYSRAERSQTWLVIEDLEASADATDLESVLLEVLDVCGCVVSAVTVSQARSGLRWQQNSLHIVPHTFDAESLTNLAESLVAAFPERFGGAATCEGLVAAASHGDRWWLVRLLDYVAHSDDAGDLTPAALREAFLHDRADGFGKAQWQAAELLTAYSEMDIWAPAHQLHPLTSVELYRLGAYRTVSGDEVRWQLPSPAARSAILCQHTSDLEVGLRTPVSEIMRLLLDGTDMRPVVQCLQRLRLIYDARPLRSVSNDFRDLLVNRLKQHASANELAQAIPLLYDLPQESQGQLVQQLADRLIHRGWPVTRVADLAACLRALQTHDHLLARGRSSARELDDFWETLLEGLWQALRLLARNMRPEEALGLLNALERLRRTELTRPGVILLCIEGLNQADPGRSADLFLAMAMASRARRLSRREGRQGNERSPLEELFGSTGWQRLTGPYRTDTNACDYLARVALRDLGRDAGNVPPPDEDIETQLLTLIPRTPLTGFAHTLYLLRKHNSGTIRLLRRVPMDAALAGQINVESPHTVAQMLLVLARLHPRTGQRLLYQPDGRPRVVLAESLAARVSRSGDLRTLNFLLNAVGLVDQEFFQGRGGFGEVMVARLLPMLKRIHGQPGRVLVNLTRWLISVDFDRKYLRELQPQYHQFLVDSLARSYLAGRGQEAELALMLAADNVLDGPFLQEMRDALDAGEIKRDALLFKMKRGQSPDALIHYHSLGLALDPDLARLYAANHPAPSTLVSSLRDKRLPAVLDAVQAVGRTLNYAGDEATVHELLTALADGPRGWAQQLLRLRHPLDMAKAISLLAALDPQLATSAVLALREAHQRDLLTIVVGGQAEPEEALELIAVLQRADPETGRWLVDQVMRNEPVWRHRRQALLEIDHPAVLGLALKRLAQLDFELEARDIHNLERLWWDLMPYMASPWTIGQLVRGATAIDEGLGHRLAAQIDARRLQSRLEPVHAGDGRALGVLLRALTQAGRREVAEELAEQLASTSLTALSLRAAVDISRAVLDISCPSGYALARQLHDDVLLPALARRQVLDADEHLLDIGWLAQGLQRLGCAPPTQRWASPGLEHPTARLWAESWLAATPERTTEVTQLLSNLMASGRPTLPWRSALVLIAAAQAGKLDDVLATGIDRTAATGARAAWQAELDALPGFR